MIQILKERKGLVRSVDIANELQFSKASVSVAMKKLRENGYVLVDGEGFLTLTPTGQEIADRVYRKHKLLEKFFIQLGVSARTAAEDACRIEHDISEETFNCLLRYAQKTTGFQEE